MNATRTDYYERPGLDLSDLFQFLDQHLAGLDTGSFRKCRGLMISGNAEILKHDLVYGLRSRYGSDLPVLVALHQSRHANSAYRGLKSALGDFFVQFYHTRGHEENLTFSKHLKDHLGTSYQLMLDFVPELSPFGNREQLTSILSLTIEAQLFPAVESLIVFLSEYFGKPVCFYCEDLQWIDGPALSLLKHLLRCLPTEKLFWVSSFQEEVPGADSWFHLIQEFNHDDIYIERFRLYPFSKEEIKNILTSIFNVVPPDKFISFCLGLTHENPETLPLIATKIKHSGLLNMKEGTIMWDSDAIKRFLEVQKEDDLVARWNQLSLPCRKILSVVACADGFDSQIIIEWLDGDAALMDRLLAEADGLELISKGERTYFFSDPSLNEIILRSLSADEKTRTHYTIARILYARGVPRLPEKVQIFMTEQFNMALEWVRKNNEQLVCAELNFLAGNNARKSNLLSKARHFFNTSAELLKECPWNEVSEQFLSVYTTLARLEYQSGDYDLAEIHLDYLLERVKEPLKRSPLFEQKVVINNRLGRYRKAVLVLREGLMEMGLEMPWTDEEVAKDVEQLTHQLKTSEGSDDEGRHELNVNKQKSILKLLFVGGMSLHHTSDGLMTWGALQIIHRSGRGIAAAEKAIGYVVYGRIMMMNNDIDRGYEYGSRALQINKSLGDISLRCRVFGIFAFFILPWKKPFGESGALLRDALEAGTRSGDLIDAYVIRTHQLNLHLLGGKPLREILSMEFEESDPVNELTWYITHYQKNLVRFLLEESTLFSIPHLQPSWLAATNTIQEEKFYRNFVWSRYYFLLGHYEQAEHAAAEAHANRKLQEGSPLIPANNLIRFLSITLAWQNFSAEQRSEYTELLDSMIFEFRIWSHHGEANYLACYHLLCAERCRIANMITEAYVHYEKANDEAGDNLWYRAVTAECFARFLLTEDGRESDALEALHASIRWYQEWGAVAKVKQLFRQFRTILSQELPTSADFNIELIQHELSGDLQVVSLVQKLLVLCMRISGSTGVFLESVEGNGELKPLGQCALLGSSGLTSLPALFGDIGNKIQLAFRSQKPLVVNDVHEERGGAYFMHRRPGEAKSYLVLPVTIRDHLSFVMYLENSFSTNTYSPDIIKCIRITLNQGAMIIENARIHEVTLRLNEEIRQKMEEKERLMQEIKRQRDEHLKSLEHTQNEDRKRIASHLHDSVGSMLSSVKMRLNSLEDEIAKNLPARAQKFGETIQLIDDSVQELRRIVYNMLPVSLSRFGLKATLQTFIEQINAAQKIEIELQILGLDERINDELEMAIYRICQELVQNVIRHAAATIIRIQLIRHDDAINMIVKDNGKGMDTSSVVHGIGFNTINAKVNLFKGSFTVESQVGKGTMVLIDIPVSR